MQQAEHTRVGYVLKRFPRLSETFILTEVLAHQSAGLDFEIFALRPPEGNLVHAGLSRLDRPVTYLPTDFDFGDFTGILDAARGWFPDIAATLAPEKMRGRDFLDLYQAIWLAHAAAERGITHLHAHFASGATTVARLASRIAGIPYSFTAHAKDIFHRSVDPDDLRSKLADAATVITISEYNLAHLRETFGTDAGGVCRVYNGLDLSHFPYTPPTGRPPHIVAVGRLIEKKGFGDLIAACGILAAAGRDFSCEIIGTGLLEHDLHAQIERLGLEGRVTLTGPLSQETVIERVRGAALLAAPCVHAADGDMDGLPTVLLEAMALGTPCISTAVTGIPEVVRDGETGLIVPEHDPETLAEAVSCLFDSEALRLQLAGAARDLLEQAFDIERNTMLLRERFAAAKPALSGEAA